MSYTHLGQEPSPYGEFEGIMHVEGLGDVGGAHIPLSENIYYQSLGMAMRYEYVPPNYVPPFYTRDCGDHWEIATGFVGRSRVVGVLCFDPDRVQITLESTDLQVEFDIPPIPKTTRTAYLTNVSNGYAAPTADDRIIVFRFLHDADRDRYLQYVAASQHQRSDDN